MTDLNSREFIIKGEASGLKLVKKIQSLILSLGSCNKRVNLTDSKHQGFGRKLKNTDLRTWWWPDCLYGQNRICSRVWEKPRWRKASKRVTNLTVLTIKISSGIAYEDEHANTSLYGGQEGGFDKSVITKSIPPVSVMTNNGKTQWFSNWNFQGWLRGYITDERSGRALQERLPKLLVQACSLLHLFRSIYIFKTLLDTEYYPMKTFLV